MDPITDIDLAERLLLNALGGTPELMTDQIADLMGIAGSLDENGETVYTSAGLNAAASTGWAWKSALTSDMYDIGGGQGVRLDESQWFEHCERKRESYLNGKASVTGKGVGRRPGITSIGLASSLTAPTPEVLK